MSSKIEPPLNQLKYPEYSSLKILLPHEKHKSLPPTLFHQFTGIDMGKVSLSSLLNYVSNYIYMREGL
jgi:hypothetical protein